MDIGTEYQTVAIPTDEPELEAQVGEHFARSRFFAIYHHESLEFTFVKNEFYNQPKAGPKASSLLGDLKINIALVPDIGEHALKTLQSKGIRVFRYTKTYSVRDAIYELFEDKLGEIR